MPDIYRTSVVAGLLICGILGTTTAQAQIAGSPWFLGGGGYGGGSYGGGTADGNFMSGAAQVIRAEGENYNLTTQGMINYETARSSYIDNTAKWSSFYWRMREANENSKRQRLERDRHSPEVLTQVAASDIPRSLSSDELDVVSGKIYWPEALMAEQFSAMRLDLEHRFELIALTTRTPEMIAQVREETRTLKEMLRSNIETIPAADYVTARKFLDSLEYSVASRRRSAPPSPPVARPPAG